MPGEPLRQVSFLDPYLYLDLRPEYAPLLKLEAQRLLLLAQDLYVWPKSYSMLTQKLDQFFWARSHERGLSGLRKASEYIVLNHFGQQKRLDRRQEVRELKLGECPGLGIPREYLPLTSLRLDLQGLYAPETLLGTFREGLP